MKDEPVAVGEDGTLVRHEEELGITTIPRSLGSITARKRVETERHEELVPREVEYGEASHVEPEANDSGEIITLEDGSVSIPLFEEQLVIEKRLVVRERIVIQKRVETETRRIEADLRREHIEIEGDVERPAD